MGGVSCFDVRGLVSCLSVYLVDSVFANILLSQMYVPRKVYK